MNVVKLGNKPYLCILKESTKVRKNILRGGAVVARWAHNPKVIGSNPVPATNFLKVLTGAVLRTSPVVSETNETKG